MNNSNGYSAKFSLLTDFIDCRTSLRQIVARIVKRQDIEDILQETFIRACAASERTEIRNPRSFMLRTARNLALNHVTTAYEKRTRIEDIESSDVCPKTEPLETRLESKERFLGFCRAVRGLPPQCRRVFVLRKVYGFSQKEIAQRLQISESTVEKHVAKGLLLCRQSMFERGHLEAGPARKSTEYGKSQLKYG